MKLTNLNLTFIAVLCITAFTTAAAPARRSAPKIVTPKIEDLPRIPLDTVDTGDPDTKIIIYSNNTWAYYRPALSAYDNLPVFSTHWDTTQVFAYKDISLADIPATVLLSLVDNPSDFHYPYKGEVRSKYGVRKRRNHNGVDISLRVGEPIYATFEGKVRYSKYNFGGYGNLVIIRHKNGLETWYAHLSKRNVDQNDYVKAGQVIGFAGSTGRSTGPHLHFEFRYCDQTFDPEFLVDFPNGKLKNETFALEKSFFNIHSRASEMLLEDEDDGFDTDDVLDPNLRLLAEMGDSTAISLIASAEFQKKQEQAIARAKAAEAAKQVQYHTVKSGDTLSAIARRYGTSISQICNFNSIKTTTKLQLGKRLRVK